MAKPLPVKEKTEIDLLKEELKKIEKVDIPFDLPTLDRIKLECESFLKDMDIDVRETKVKFTYVPLGIGRAIYRMLKAKPELISIWDKKKLTVALIEKDVSSIVEEGKQSLYLKSEQAGYGFEILNHIRIADDIVDVQLVELSIKSIKENTSKENMIFVQDEKAVALRLKIQQILAEQKAIAKAKDERERAEAAAKKASAVVPTSVVKKDVTLPKEPIAPIRSDKKYDSMFGDLDYEDDLKDYQTLHVKWESDCKALTFVQSPVVPTDLAVVGEVCEGQLSIDDLDEAEIGDNEIDEDEDGE